MPLFLPLLAARAWSAPLPPYVYARPDAADPAALDAYQLPGWPARTVLYAVAADVNVYDAPGGKRVGVLGFGDPVKVEEAGARARVADRVEQWYRVSGAHPGWVFGGDLTPFRWEADLDGDGEAEIATAAWRSDFSVRVRVFEPNLRAGSTMQIDVESAGGAYLSQQGANLEADLIPASKAGTALIHLHVGVEACADFRDDWISYTSPGPVKIGSERVALSLGGVMDPPSVSTFEVEFSGKRKTAYVTWHRATAEGQEPSVETERYVLRDGEFLKEKDGAVAR